MAHIWEKGVKMRLDNCYLIIVQVFGIFFHLPRSSIWNKDLLLHVNPYKTSKNVHTKAPLHVFRSVWEMVKPNFYSDFKAQNLFECLSFEQF